MNAKEGAGSSYGSSGDWAKIISGAGQGASAGLQANASNASSKKEAKEAKRRTLANLLNSSLKRNQGLFRLGQEHSDDMNDFQSQALQQVARGFIESLHGSTGRKI